MYDYNDQPAAGVGFCPFAKASPESSVRMSLICVAHLIMTPSIADFKYRSTTSPLLKNKVLLFSSEIDVHLPLLLKE